MQYIDKSKDEFLSEIYKSVKKIRDEIGLKTTDFSIIDFEFTKNENNLTLKLYTPIRTDKSAIIGPGGWVIGKLREELNEIFEENLIIRVENYIDHIQKLEHFESSFNFLKEKGLDLTSKKDAVVVIQCENDLSALETIKKYFNPICISFDLGTVALPHKNKNRILEVLENKKILHKILTPFSMSKEDIATASSVDPCIEVCNKLVTNMLDEAALNNVNIVIFNHLSKNYELKNDIHVINFLELFPIKLNALNHAGKPLDCPLLIQSCRKNKNMKIDKIKDVVSKVYDGYIEPTEGSVEIMKFIN